jgi:dolichol-phosphate mannosyltransferase
MSDTLIVIPTYNEAENIEKLLTLLKQEIPAASILIVDDNSPDGTGKKVEAFIPQNPQVHLLHRPHKEGLGQAYLAAFHYILQHPPFQSIQYILQMDADFSHPPSYIPALLRACQEDHADLSLGSRYVPGGSIEGWSLGRRLLSRFGSLYARFWLKMPFKDLTGGFKCWKRKTLEALPLHAVKSTGYCFQVELTYRTYLQNSKILEVPITFPERTYGKSKMSFHIALEAALLVPFLSRQVKKS